MLGLLLDAETVAIGVELSHAVALGVVHVVAEDGRLAVALHVLHALAQQLCEAGSVENVVAQYEASAVVADKLFADDERLSQTAWIRLLSVFEAYAVVATVAQKTLESRQVVRGGYDEDILYVSEHEH